MTEGHRNNLFGECKLAWDEENRLTAVCDNGYVSAYLYDADGERVFKTSGDATHMYVNAAEAPGAETDTRSFTLYVSPYLVVCEDGRYTKHFYAGSQRIVSKVGDRASYGSDPRTIDRAGNDYDSELRVDYEAKKAALEGAIAAQYEVFGVPFRGIDHDNRTDAPRRSFADPAQYEGQQYFYHPDHLGSTSYVTDADGNVAQHVEYVPFGEVLVDQRAADWHAPYLFNAKELDEETGLYYYGARYYDPRLSLWLSTDPMQEKYPEVTSYCYSVANPVKFTDPTGMEINMNKLVLADESLGHSTTQLVINDLISQTGLKLSLDENNKLQYAKNENGTPIISNTTDGKGNEIYSGSKTARKFLMKMIDHKTEIDVSYGASSQT